MSDHGVRERQNRTLGGIEGKRRGFKKLKRFEKDLKLRPGEPVLTGAGGRGKKKRKNWKKEEGKRGGTSAQWEGAKE